MGAIHYSIRVVKEMNYLSQVITHSRRNKLFSPLIGKEVRVSSRPGDLSAYVTTTAVTHLVDYLKRETAQSFPREHKPLPGLMVHPAQICKCWWIKFSIDVLYRLSSLREPVSPNENVSTAVPRDEGKSSLGD